MEPREIVRRIEANPSLPPGEGDRFAGYAVMGLPFRSGHVLALRRFAASSVGPAYTSVWHRDPRGIWTFYSTVNPDLGCARYFGREIMRNVVTPINIEWSGPARFTVTIGTVLRWGVSLAKSLPIRFVNLAASLLPAAWWQSPSVLKTMGAATRFMLGTGKMSFAGRTPNGQEFVANPGCVWFVDSSYATLNGVDFGPPGALTPQARLCDVFIPQRGIFGVACLCLQTPKKRSSMLLMPGSLEVN